MPDTVEDTYEHDYVYLHDVLDDVLFGLREDQLNLASEACRNTIRDAIIRRIINDFEEQENNG